MIKRRIILASLTVFLLSGWALAAGMQDRIVAQLRQQGFTEILVTSTLLGRTRVVARGPGERREIIFNERTGEILRDLWQFSDDEDVRGQLFSSEGGARNSRQNDRERSTGGTSGESKSNNGDNRDDDSDDDDGDDDDD
ncbi:hypothetical protein C8N32_10624 [Rhodovulum imhoffii]|uniref:YpeB-like protein with protease inhibitory function n=1 Tax=Rhodovulum imhoffii TaxID=365340 RepID=A0A2T5BST0_9RHOB|nr:hypothetical protein [Rhodovulum imhoffii]MBK5934994.1 hypothetical protein [Rhodovulum imhoffii]PTN02453.1 hypothetical protein C8N32_10624 [Rhodovulum imhoffii]